MRLTLAYGTDGLEVEVPDDAVVVDGEDPPRLADEDRAVRTQGQKSQREKSKQTLCVLGALDDEAIEFSS